MIMYLHVSFWLKMDPSKVPKRFKSIAFSILFVLYLLRLSNDNAIQLLQERYDPSVCKSIFNLYWCKIEQNLWMLFANCEGF